MSGRLQTPPPPPHLLIEIRPDAQLQPLRRLLDKPLRGNWVLSPRSLKPQTLILIPPSKEFVFEELRLAADIVEETQEARGKGRGGPKSPSPETLSLPNPGPTLGNRPKAIARVSCKALSPIPSVDESNYRNCPPIRL